MLIGLTGTFSSGKSLVAQIFHEAGDAAVIDADAIAREVVEPGSDALRDIRDEFGPQYILADGHLDRKRMAQAVFSAPEKRKTLNDIIHPRVREKICQQVHCIETAPPSPPLIILDVPLLLETGLDRKVSQVTVVTISESQRYRRARRRDQLTEAQVTRRLAAQWPQRQKIKRADALIDNSGSIEATRRQVHSLHAHLLEEAAQDQESSPSGKGNEPARKRERQSSQ